jgi:hypothetical protein
MSFNLKLVADHRATAKIGEIYRQYAKTPKTPEIFKFKFFLCLYKIT